MLKLLKMNYTKPFLLLVLLFIQLISFAQATNKTETDTTAISGKINEVTITAFRSPYNLFNTPAPVNLIGPLQLETGSSLTPVEALNQVPGILMHNATLNTNRLTIRGIGSRSLYATNKIKAYFGEIPLTSGDGETTLEDLDNSAIKRVEIIKGPSSSLYGAGLAGVILFHPNTVTKNFVQNRISSASFGTIKNTLSAGIIQNKMNIYALGSYLKSDGYRENNTTNRANILLNSIYSVTANSNLQILLNATKMKAYIPSSLDKEMFENTPEKAAPNWAAIQGYEDYYNARIGLSYNLITDKNEKVALATFGSYRKADELRPFNRLKENSDYIGFRAYVQKVITSKNSKYTLTSGLEFFREKYYWSTISNENQNELLSDNIEKRRYENLFIQLESELYEKLYISAGINGNLTNFYYTDLFTENGDQSGEHQYKPVFSPRIGINYVISRNLSIFGNVSQGFSTPTFEETLLPDGEVNKDIKPETGWNYEAGIRTLVSNRIQFTASYFRIYISNLLVARRTGEDAYIGVNAGKSIHPGLETEIRWNITKPEAYPVFTLIGNATFANYHFQDFVDLENDYSGNNLPGTAKNTWMLMAVINPFRNAGLTFWHRYTGKMAVNDANTGYSDAFGITNFEAGFSPRIGKMRFGLKGGIQNIFDIHYASMLAVNTLAFGNNLPRYYYPGNPRNFYVSLLIGLG